MIVLFVDGGWAAGLCCFGILVGTEILWAPFFVVDKVVAEDYADGKRTTITECDVINR